MKGYVADIDDITEANKDYRHILYTGQNLQLVLRSLKPGQDIGAETHATHDQIFRIERGKGHDRRGNHKDKSGARIVVPAEAHHNLVNTWDKSRWAQMFERYICIQFAGTHRGGKVKR